MSVPLDRLYHYLENLVDRDVIIYRWMPHGSRNLVDLTPLRPVPNTILQHSVPGIVMHDQEHLQYNFYNRHFLVPYVLDSPEVTSFVANENSIDFLEKLHLRYRLTPSLFPVTIVHSELRSDEVKKYQDHGYLTCYYWSHAIIARDWYRFAEYDLDLFYNHDNIKHDFLVYNRAWTGTREYRLFFSELLVKNSLVDSCKTSFSSRCDQTFYLNHNFQNQKFQVHKKNLEDFFEKNTSPSWSSADYSNKDYKETAIEIVLETLFDDSRWHLTEKIFRPIACGKPFILASTPGSLEYLRSYGFKTFHPIINEEYDLIQDPVKRLVAIVSEMSRIQKLTKIQKKELFIKLHAISEHNKKIFFSSKLHTRVFDEFDMNITQCMQKADQLESFDPIEQRLTFNKRYFNPSKYRNLLKNYDLIKSFFKTRQQSSMTSLDPPK